MEGMQECREGDQRKNSVMIDSGWRGGFGLIKMQSISLGSQGRLGREWDSTTSGPVGVR